MNILVTGGAGFIGSAVIRHIIKNTSNQNQVLNIDKLTYAGNLESLIDDPCCQIRRTKLGRF